MAQEIFGEDEVLGKAYDAKLMKRLLGFIAPYKKYVIFAIILNIFVAILSAVGPMLTKIAVDDYISKSDYHGLLIISLTYRFTDSSGNDTILSHVFYTVHRSKNSL